MIAESIKNLLGEDLSKQVEEALKGKGKDGKDLDCVAGNDGTYVPAEKHEAEKQKAIKADNLVKQVSDALKGLGGSGDVEKINDDIQTAQNTINDLKNTHKKELEQLAKTTALKLALNGKAHDTDDIIALLDMDTVKVDKDGNLINSIDDLIKPIKEKKSYLFKDEKQDVPDMKGVVPAGGEKSPLPTSKSETRVTAL